MTHNFGKLSRSVSIIGTGCTPFGDHQTNPALQNLTEHEMFAWAALDAMEDAGIEGKDINALFHGQIGNVSFTRTLTPAVQYQDWIGMHGKPSFHHEEACGTGYVAFNLAVMAVASGVYDIVLTGGVELLSSMANPKKPSHIREATNPLYRRNEIPELLCDPTFSRFPGNVTQFCVFDYLPLDYVRKYGLTHEQFDDACNALAIQSRRASSRHPLAYYQKELADVACEAGYSDVMEYLRSDANMKQTQFYRKYHGIHTVDGASAVIVCSSDIAKKFRQQPIEVLGISAASMDTRHPRNEQLITEIAIKQVYETTGVKPPEIDLFLTQDLKIFEQVETAEVAGYLPHGEGWRAAIEGLTAFDGEKPINTSGGRCAFGHAYGASGLADVGEIVQQMRGQCGQRQIKKLPETAMLRGMGGGQNATAAIFRTLQ